MTDHSATTLNQCADHAQFSSHNSGATRRTLWAVIITASMMVIEIVAGTIFNSMALLADGWHMSTHAIALAISLFAYLFSRKNAHNQRFSFGTWKIEVLGGYSSALLLMGVAIFMAGHAVDRMLHPQTIDYTPAIVVAIIGLVVNLVCARLLHDSGHHHHEGHDHHAHSHHHSHHDHAPQHSHDLNLRAAYLHVLADALTSVFAIIALLAGLFFGLNWLDPFMAIVGSVLIAVWAIGLLKHTSLALLDADVQPQIQTEIQSLLQQHALTLFVNDLHVWRVGQNQYACIISVAQAANFSVAQIKQQLSACHELVHLTVEIA
ncbi:MAG: cation transporter [Moraxellaceae bacterium]|nr:MAG: cation transporter [Moraxellaceae bacterium]